jgi:hypothetical protein
MIRELTQDEYDYFIESDFLRKKEFGRDELVKIFEIYNSIFNARERVTTCGSCVRRIHESLSYVIKHSPYYRIN